MYETDDQNLVVTGTRNPTQSSHATYHSPSFFDFSFTQKLPTLHYLAHVLEHKTPLHDVDLFLGNLND